MKNNNEKALKYDQKKLRWDLLPLEPIKEIVKVYTFGANKYSENTWQNLDDFENRYYAALLRHLTAWRMGEELDPESEIHHLAHCCWNSIALLWKVLRNKKD